MNKVIDSAGNWPQAAKVHGQKVSAIVPHLGGHLDGEAGASNCARVTCLS